MNLFRLETHFAGDHGGTSVTVSAVIAACRKDAVQQSSSGDDQLQLATVMRAGMSPRHSVVRLYRTECFCNDTTNDCRFPCVINFLWVFNEARAHGSDVLGCQFQCWWLY